MLVPGLIEKLIFAGAVEKDPDELRFTYAFIGFIRCSAHIENENRPKDGSVEENWRKILRDFNYTLESLSYEEVVALILLLESHFNDSSEKKEAPPS